MTQSESLRSCFRDIKPDLAVNAAAPEVLSEAVKSIGGALIHYSTDYVFDGGKGSPYFESDPPGQLSAYA